MTQEALDQLLWFGSRTAALTAFFVLAAAILSGLALRSSLFQGWLPGRELSSVHRFLTALWIPLVLAHVGLILADRTAHLRVLDAVWPFHAPYGVLAIGLGALGFDLLIVITVTSYLRRWLGAALWRWLHRLSYIMFAVFFLHAQLAGSDLNRPAISAVFWGVAAAIGMLALARISFGRLAE